MDSRTDPTGRRRMGSLESGLLRIHIRIDYGNDGHAVQRGTFLSNIDRGCGTIELFHRRPLIPPSLTHSGTQVLYLLKEQLSRTPPPKIAPENWGTGRELERNVSHARQIFHQTVENLRYVDATIGRGLEDHQFARRLILGNARMETSCFARSIVQCLRLLQTSFRPPLSMCLGCTLPPAEARGPADPLAHNVLEVASFHVSSAGCTTIDAVCILPPIQEFDPPMLCKQHQYIFQFLMYQVVSPSWPVPYLLEDRASFGEIPVGWPDSDSETDSNSD